MDKLRQSEFRYQVFEAARQEAEDKLIRKVQEASLTSETKHKTRKDLTSYTEKWYRNFMIENYESNLIQLPDDIEPRKTPCKKVTNSEAQTQITPEKLSPGCESSGSEFQVSPESTLKKESDDDKFLEPLPVKKAKVETKMSSMYAPGIPNPMDLEVRKEFTPMVKFVDFNSTTTENALYGPAMIQKVQQTEKSSVVSIANTAVSSEMNSQISVSKDTSKSHFIKRKQSHCNVKRSCGVSYVKKTESK